MVDNNSEQKTERQQLPNAKKRESLYNKETRIFQLQREKEKKRKHIDITEMCEITWTQAAPICDVYHPITQMCRVQVSGGCMGILHTNLLGSLTPHTITHSAMWGMTENK